jgi:hypothetical protein
MSVKTLDGWSALSTRPGNPAALWPRGFVNVDLFKGFVHIGYPRVLSRTAVLSCMLRCCLLQSENQSEHIRHLAHLVGSGHWAAHVWVSLCSL